MLPGESLATPTLLALVVALTGATVGCLLSLLYLRRVRMDRPAIGVFNARDIAIIFIFIVGLPLLYLAVPLVVLIVLFGITFTSALAIGLRPVLGNAGGWVATGVLIALDVWTGRNLMGTVVGWQVFWIINSIVVVLAAVSISNLYVQGGMKLRHVAWFALILAGYDLIFTFIFPVTNFLAQRIIGYPLDPSVGFRMGIFNATLGIGDMLVYSAFVIGAYKAYGRRSTLPSMVIVVIFGAVVPALAPNIFRFFIDARTDLIVPAQTAFGPVAFLLYLWFKHKWGPERTMAQFVVANDIPSRNVISAADPAAPRTGTTVPVDGVTETIAAVPRTSPVAVGRNLIERQRSSSDPG